MSDPWWSWDTEDDGNWLSEFSGEDVRALVRERNWLLVAWANDLTDDETMRLADAIARADFHNWGSYEVAEKIAGTVRAIAAARLRVSAP